MQDSGLMKMQDKYFFLYFSICKLILEKIYGKTLSTHQEQCCNILFKQLAAHNSYFICNSGMIVRSCFPLFVKNNFSGNLKKNSLKRYSK